MGKAARFFTGLVVLLLVSITAKNTYGDTFDISWTGGYGPGTAVLTTTNVPVAGTLTVTAIISGTQNGLAISSLLPQCVFDPTTMNCSPGYGGNNNFIYPSSFSPGCPIAFCAVDSMGVAFSVGSTDYNLFLNTAGYAECSSAVTACITISQVNLSVPVTSVTLTEVPASGVPEPSSLILLSVGLLVFVGAAWRKRTVVGSAA